MNRSMYGDTNLSLTGEDVVIVVHLIELDTLIEHIQLLCC